MAEAPTANAHEALAERFRRRILAGRLRPGERLREVPLAREFGVSRGPIRDTFLRLTQEGLLEATPNAGVRVARAPSPFKRRTLVQVRRTLETRALGEAFECDPEALLAALDANLAAYLKACRREALEDVVALDMAFHRTIVAAADGGSLLDVWLPAVSQMMLRYSRHRSLVESHDEHAAVAEAIRAHDRAEAARALRRHIV